MPGNNSQRILGNGKNSQENLGIIPKEFWETIYFWEMASDFWEIWVNFWEIEPNFWEIGPKFWEIGPNFWEMCDFRETFSKNGGSILGNLGQLLGNRA